MASGSKKEWLELALGLLVSALLTAAGLAAAAIELTEAMIRSRLVHPESERALVAAPQCQDAHGPIGSHSGGVALEGVNPGSETAQTMNTSNKFMFTT